MKTLLNSLKALVVAIVMVSCGGGTDVAEITGSGSRQGDIEAFGSVFIAGERYNTDEAVVVFDGSEGSGESELRVGMQAKLTLRPKAHRIIDRMDVSSRLVGVVGSTDLTNNRFFLLGQEVRVDDRTVLDCCEQNGLNAGDTIRVFASEIEDGVLLASLVEAVAYVDELVAGTVSAINGADVQVAGLTVDISALSDRSVAVRVGERVRASGQRNLVLSPDRLVATAFDKTELLAIRVGEPVELSGVISHYQSLLKGRVVEFEMDGLPIRHLDGTDMLINKPIDGSQNGDRVVVTGFATDDGFVRAQIIRHISPVEAEVESHITAIDSQANTVTLLGNVTAELGAKSQFIRAPLGGNRAFSFQDLQLGDRVELRVARVDVFGSRDQVLSEAGLEIARVTVLDGEAAESGVNDLMVAPLESSDSATRQIVLLGNLVTLDDNTQFDSHDSEAEFFAAVKNGDVLEVELSNTGAQLLALEISLDNGELSHDSALDD